MIQPRIEECLDKVDSKYALSVLVAKRVKELQYKMAGEFATSKTKELTYALQEVADGKIVPMHTDRGAGH
jgi:DNA-directed RNA polymerase subunit omega